MKYAEYRERSYLDRQEILAMAYGRLIEDPPEGFGTRLPLPPMLMVDRVVEVTRSGKRGRIVGEQDLRLDAWFFHSHFLGDPVQPGCLGVDAVWQLVGLYCSMNGALGTGRALGCGEVDFFGQIRPHDELVRYEIDIVRYQELPSSGASIAIGDARVLVDGDEIYTISRAKVGVFRDIAYPDYPWPSEHSRGGKMEDA
ncbi:MAG: bifunctional 3-hydroxydecanoyl-ACP dehydratase/trans-2-decenoyl-ACP isomerase [Gemmatimonadota bacterium]|nr:bifunctional 3-hydroxydecanoyl-ACP dehydratase/trans-2-decenoyl-ACP isomerase [Gemmatimonadota bacterium]